MFRTPSWYTWKIEVKESNRQCLSMVCKLINNDISYHSGKNVIYLRGGAAESPQHFIFTTISTSTKKILSVYDLYGTRWREQRCLYSCRQQQIGQSDCDFTTNCGKITDRSLGCRGKPNIDVMKKKLIYRSFSHSYGEIIRPLTITQCSAKPEIANQCFTISVRKFSEGTSITDLNK